MSWSEEQYAAHLARLKAPQDGTPVPAPDVPEALIEAECTTILEADGWRALRTDPVSDRGRGKGFGEVGMADHLYIRYCYSDGCCEASSEIGGPWDINARLKWTAAMWIEFKAPRGRVSKAQRAWHIRERARGALTLIAGEDFPASVEGFREWYAKSGLQRRQRA